MKKRPGKGEEKSICKMEELKERAREELFLLFWCVQSGPFWLSFSMLLSFPPPPLVSLVLFFSPSLWSVHCCRSYCSRLGVSLSFCVFCVIECVFVELDYMGGAAQGLASGVNEPNDEARKAETTTPSSPPPVSQHPNTHRLIHTHTIQTHMFSPDIQRVHLP